MGKEGLGERRSPDKSGTEKKEGNRGGEGAQDLAVKGGIRSFRVADRPLNARTRGKENTREDH